MGFVVIGLLLLMLLIRLLTLLGLDCRSVTGDVPSSGTSRLALTAALRGWVSFIAGELVWIGNLVAGGSLDRSLRWDRPFEWGAGLLFRDFEAIARFRASMFARRLLSSVLIALMRAELEALPPLGVCESVDARLSSPKISSLCAKRSRMRRYACFSCIVTAVSVRGRRIQGARVFARAET